MRQKQKTTPRFIFEIYISMPLTDQGKEKQNKKRFFLHLHFKQFWVIYNSRGHCTKRNAQVLCLSFKHDLFSLPSFRSALRFCL